MPVAQHNARRRRGSAYHAAAAARFSASNNSAKLWQWCWLGLASQLVFPPTGQKNLNFPPHALRKCCCITASWQASAAAAIMLRCSAATPPRRRAAAAPPQLDIIYGHRSHTRTKSLEISTNFVMCVHIQPEKQDLLLRLLPWYIYLLPSLRLVLQMFLICYSFKAGFCIWVLISIGSRLIFTVLIYVCTKTKVEIIDLTSRKQKFHNFRRSYFQKHYWLDSSKMYLLCVNIQY